VPRPENWPFNLQIGAWDPDNVRPVTAGAMAIAITFGLRGGAIIWGWSLLGFP